MVGCYEVLAVRERLCKAHDSVWSDSVSLLRSKMRGSFLGTEKGDATAEHRACLCTQNTAWHQKGHDCGDDGTDDAEVSV